MKNVEKNRSAKNEGLKEVFIDLETPSWGFQVIFYFLKQIKITWLGKGYVRITYSSGIQNKLICLEKSSPFCHMLSAVQQQMQPF